jgi:hypothetical protein
MKNDKIFMFFVLVIAGMIAAVWDILFYIVTHVYMICKIIDAWGDRKLEEFGSWYDSSRE